ncbi:MAG: hypothetical protein IJ738_02785 [Alphaproteobacteria bacterium]|nr:hypothetical protein [Alphaproteobacteria bacterium]MBR1756478.1 hypothetical protein [Alphaproteobacteria bacterium]
MKKIGALIIGCCWLGACSYFSGGVGQLVYHWERTRTGVERFVRDHKECLQHGKAIKWFPDFQSWFYTEETHLNTRADWNSDRGIWASYIPYEGATPLIVNAPYDDYDIDPHKYVTCMKEKGYWFRNHDIPEITNINLYKARQPNLWHPFSQRDYYD